MRRLGPTSPARSCWKTGQRFALILPTLTLTCFICGVERIQGKAVGLTPLIASCESLQILMTETATKGAANTGTLYRGRIIVGPLEGRKAG
jgi:hypothetical protein